MPRQRIRASVPGRARDANQRRRTFQRGHPKRGGRRRGTANILSADFKKAILEAAYRIGYDGNGTDGLAGYLKWVAVYHPRIYVFLLGQVLPLQELERTFPPEPYPTAEELNERVRDIIAGSRGNVEQEFDFLPRDPSAEWTGQDFPLSSLMHLAVTSPDQFCKLLATAFLRAAGKRRVLARPR